MVRSGLLLCAIALTSPGWLGACADPVQVPGDEILGAFQIDARMLESGCANTLQTDELPASGGFSFEAILSREKGTDTGYLTLNGISREGVFDGQVFTSSFVAPRRFAWRADVHCTDNDFQVSETVRVVMLSASQDQVLGGCPDDPTALLAPGGVPVDVDAGVVPPEARPEGFDARRVCGFLVDVIAPTQACGMPACNVVYGVEGVKKQ